MGIRRLMSEFKQKYSVIYLLVVFIHSFHFYRPLHISLFPIVMIFFLLIWWFFASQEIGEEAGGRTSWGGIIFPQFIAPSNWPLLLLLMLRVSFNFLGFFQFVSFNPHSWAKLLGFRRWGGNEGEGGDWKGIGKKPLFIMQKKQKSGERMEARMKK
jgi:hypothetical protein